MPARVEVGAEAGSLEPAPEVALLAGVAEACQPEVQPLRAEPIQEACRSPARRRSARWRRARRRGSRPRRSASASSACWSLIPSTSTTARARAGEGYIRSIIACPKPEQETSCRVVHQPREVVRDLLVGDRGAERVDDQVRGLDPAQVAEHHLGREDQRARVDLVLAGVLRRRAVRRLEHRDRVGEVRRPARCRSRRPGRRARPRCSRRSGSASRSRRTRPAAAGSAAGRRRRSRP